MYKEYYHNLRNRYLPKTLKLIFILESPPASGKYFYDETGYTSEPLFNELMKALQYRPKNKKDGLEFFKGKGFFLIDSTYNPVDKLKENERRDVILSDFNNFLADLQEINLNESPLILVKANVCRLLEENLKTRGFNVLNEGIIVPFPSNGQQNRFQNKIKKILDKIK